MTVDKIDNPTELKQFLRGLGITIPEDVISQVVSVLSGKTDKSLYSLYVNRPDRPIPICGKGTVYKIRKLYNEGKLEPYLTYLQQSPIADEPKTEQTKDSNVAEILQEQASVELDIAIRTSQDLVRQRLNEHFDELAAIAKRFASRVQKLLYCKSEGAEYFVSGGNIIDGLRVVGAPFLDWEEITGGIKPHLSRCVFVHYEDKFGKSPYDYWEDVTTENVTQETADNLLRLAHSNAFNPCPKCQVCVELAGLKPVSEGSFPYYDEKTGKVTYVPPDF